MNANNRKLTETQEWVLRSIFDHGPNLGVSWVGTPQGARKGLVDRGLVDDVSRDYVKGRHIGSSLYRITELGVSVLGAIYFDRGMAEGREAWGAKLDAQREADHAQAIAMNHEWDISHGIRYRESKDIEADVRAVIWKNVVIAK